MHRARLLGTYATSSQKFEDCCPLFMPKNPIIHSQAGSATQAESALDVEALVKLGVGGATLERFHFKAGEVVACGATDAPPDPVVSP